MRSLAIAGLALGCGSSETVTPERPSEPTLSIAPDPHAPQAGRRVVAVGKIAQTWHVGSWAPASITLTSVEAGDAIVALGAYWGDLPRGASTAPTDSRGTLHREIDQGAAVVGRLKPAVFANLYVELDAAPGAHTITPPFLGGPAGDGALYVIQIRGLTEHRVIALGQNRLASPALDRIGVALFGLAQPDDLVIALGGYDNTAPIDHVTWTPPAGFTVLASEDDGANNVPSLACTRVAPIGPIVWSWIDPTVNVAVAVAVALR
jgi:hypothetical protein